MRLYETGRCGARATSAAGPGPAPWASSPPSGCVSGRPPLPYSLAQ